MVTYRNASVWLDWVLADDPFYSCSSRKWCSLYTIFILCVSYDSFGDQTLSSLLNLAFPVLFVGLKMIFSKCKSCFFSKPPNTLNSSLTIKTSCKCILSVFKMSSLFNCSYYSLHLRWKLFSESQSLKLWNEVRSMQSWKVQEDNLIF